MIHHDGKALTIDGREYALQYPIIDAFDIGDVIVVLFDPNAYEQAFGQFPNVVGLSRDGEIRWRAELPTTTSGDRYYKLSWNGGLRASSMYSFVCALDPQTGRIVSKEYVK